MKIEVTRISTSKKGKVWLQVKLIEGEQPDVGEVFDCAIDEALSIPESKETLCKTEDQNSNSL